jgi:hypothetical protein
MPIQDRIFGKPLATSEERAEQIGVGAGIPIFGLDALTSAAYGPEAALSLLIPLGMLGTQYLLPIVTSILILLVIVYFSYRQTIAAYPTGGGSYTVASENLGERAGLLAAAALMIDYILTAAVGISAGVTALTSALPRFQPHTLLLCLLILTILAVVNLRGVKDTGTAFIVPTFLFIGTLLTLIAVGVYKTFAAGGHPLPVTTLPPALPQTVQYLGLWMLLKAFSSGCAAMTGVEAVSNGVMAFREPRSRNAQYALTVIIGILIVMLYGTAWLTKHYQIMAMDPDATGYQSLLSLLVTAVFGRGWFYFLTMGSVLLALALLARHLRALRPHCGDPDPVQGGNRQTHSAVCDRSVFGFHAVASGHGRSLEEAARRAQGQGVAHAGEWHGRGRDRAHHHRGIGLQVHVGSMGDRAAGSNADPADVLGEEALHARSRRAAGQESA